MTFSPLYIHIPAHLLPGRLSFLLNRKLQPEVACQETVLERLDYELLGDCAAQLQEQGLSTTLHAPYSGFNPGSNKKRIRKLSYSLVDKSLSLAEKLHARRVIFHPGLPYGSTGKPVAEWLQQSRAFWPEFLDRAQEIGCIICIENIYETGPEILTDLLGSIDSPFMGHVFDIGHWNLFSSVKLHDWLDATVPFLKHLHLHDNHGERDEHLAIGGGYVPFSSLFEWLEKSKLTPTMTLENHNLPDTEQSLKTMQRFLLPHTQ